MDEGHFYVRITVDVITRKGKRRELLGRKTRGPYCVDHELGVVHQVAEQIIDEVVQEVRLKRQAEGRD